MMATKSFYKSIFSAFFFLFCINNKNIKAQSYVQITSTSGAISGAYINLGNAISHINDGTYSGDILIEVTGTVNENMYGSTINASGIGSANYTSILIKPKAGSTAKINCSAFNSIISMLGSNITIDGSNNGTSSRDLTFQTDATNYVGAINIDIGSNNASKPSKNITIRNINVINGLNKYTIGIWLHDYFNNITLQNNQFQHIGTGIQCNATIAPSNGTGVNIIGNDLYSVNPVGSYSLGQYGILFNGISSSIIRNNTFGNFENIYATQESAIYLDNGTSNITIEKNKIIGIGNSNYNSASGIYIKTGVINSNINISNNIISDINGNGSSTSQLDNNPVGILLSGNQSGVNIYHNTINLQGNLLNKSNGTSIGVFLGTGSNACINNNIIVNNLGLNSSVGYGTVGVLAESSTSQFTSISNNDYSILPTGTGIKAFGKIGSTAYTSFDSWQAIDANAKNITPTFISSSDLHLASTGNSGLMAGTPLSTVNTDFDNQYRSSSTPYIGADEIVNVDLSGLSISPGILSPSFVSNALTYTTSVAYNISTITITPTASDASSFIKVNGLTVTSGNSTPVSLNYGSNVINIIVSDANGNSKSYSVTVTRANPPSTNANLANLILSSGTIVPTFSSSITSYTATVSNGTASITVSPYVSDGTATIKVNGTAVANTTPSSPIALTVGSNLINVVVTAQDGTTTKTYTVNVTRSSAPSNNADLASIDLSVGKLSPSYLSTTTNYTVSVSNSITSITLTPTVADPGATLKINGRTAFSGNPKTISLPIGNTTVQIQVKAQDGTLKTYNIIITRAATLSANANLSDLIVSSGILTPSFISNTTNYNVDVPYTTSIINVTPTVSDPAASVRVNGNPVTSGNTSQNINISVGSNIVPIQVTAENGTINTYTITFNRAALSTNADLSSLVINAAVLSPTFSNSITSYNSSVPNQTSSITVTPTLSDPNASQLTVNGQILDNGTTSAPITLNQGDNIIDIMVTAQDNITTKDYTITITKAAPLPITLKSFFGTLTQNKSFLSWISLSEENTSHFIVEYATDGVHFSTLATVTAAGNSSIERSYSYEHLSPQKGLNYYRLKIVDKDGRFKYSAIVRIAHDQNISLQCFPNPTQDQLTVLHEQSEAPATISVINIVGQRFIVIPVQPGTNQTNINLHSLSAGHYTLQWSDKKSTQSINFIKQ